MSWALAKLCFISYLGIAVEASNGSIAAGHASNCCGSLLGGTCADGSYGTPCCGNGQCNAFCCACDGGCRAAPSPSPPNPVAPSASSTPLNEWPMITSHDAATSYYNSNTCTLSKAVANYVMTQAPGTFTSQLNCGSRAFDLRPKVDGGKLVAHHGAVTVNIGIATILKEITQWASQNPKELVLVYGSSCDGTDCEKMFFEALTSANIVRVEGSDIKDLTLGTALQRGRLSTGGSVLAVWGGVEENYDPSISCYSQLAKEEVAALNATLNGNPHNSSLKAARGLFSCYGSEAQKAFDPLWSYMTSMTDGRGKQQGKFWMAQAHWQYDTSSVIQGELKLSCILKDESKSGVNKKLADKISSGLFPHINLLEVDDVCGGNGPELLSALRSRFTYDISLDDEAVVV